MSSVITSPFSTPVYNRWLGILANLPIGVPVSVTFQKYRPGAPSFPRSRWHGYGYPKPHGVQLGNQCSDKSHMGSLPTLLLRSSASFSQTKTPWCLGAYQLCHSNRLWCYYDLLLGLESVCLSKSSPHLLAAECTRWLVVLFQSITSSSHSRRHILTMVLWIFLLGVLATIMNTMISQGLLDASSIK